MKNTPVYTFEFLRDQEGRARLNVVVNSNSNEEDPSIDGSCILACHIRLCNYIINAERMLFLKQGFC